MAQEREDNQQGILTVREVEVLALVAQALRDREIGERLFISTGTVRTHLRSILAKLGVERRGQAAAWWGSQPVVVVKPRPSPPPRPSHYETRICCLPGCDLPVTRLPSGFQSRTWFCCQQHNMLYHGLNSKSVVKEGQKGE